MRSRRVSAILSVISAITLLTSPPAEAQAQPEPATLEKTTRIIMISMPGVDIGTLSSLLESGRLPNTQRLVKEGASGLMNSVTGKRLEPPDAYATLGAGRRISGGPYAGAAYDYLEKAGNLRAFELYRTRLGFDPPPIEASAILHTGIAAMAKESRNTSDSTAIGALGKTLRAAGLKTAVLGNADYQDAQSGEQLLGRWVVAIAMDDRGVVPHGSVGPSTLKPDPGFPGGVVTDYRMLKKAMIPLITGQVSLIVVEAGDTWRVQGQGETLSTRAQERAMTTALERLDVFIGWLLRYLDPTRDMVILLSPSPSIAARQLGDSLLPVVMWGRGMTYGILHSGTTHQPGLIANIDIAATILSRMNLAIPDVMTGQPAIAIPLAAPLDIMAQLRTIHDNALLNHLRRPVLLKGYISLQIGVLLTGLGLFLAKLPLRPWFGFTLLALSTGPLAFLILGAAPSLSPAGSYAMMIFLVVALTALASIAGKGKWIASFTAIAIATAVSVALDTLQGSRFMSMSPLGHSLISGARFYGIGNEYMGVLIGSALVGGSVLAGIRPWLRWAVSSIWAGILILLSWPSLGANFGGSIAAAAAFPFAATRLIRRGISRGSALQTAKTLSAMTLAATVIVSLAVAWDALSVQDAQTHVGRAIENLTVPGGWGEVKEVIERKVLLNWRLIRWTNWSLLFLISLGIYAWISFRPPEAFKRILGQTPGLAHGLSGVAIGSIAALIFNDSGIVAAATCMIFASAPLLFLMLQSNGECQTFKNQSRCHKRL